MIINSKFVQVQGLIKENIIIAFRAIRAQLLRAIITMAIIAIGIMALVSILTAIDAIKGSVSNNFAEMGANTFSIRNKGVSFTRRSHGRGEKAFPVISYREAVNFKKDFDFHSNVSISANGSGSKVVKYNSIKTNPTVGIIGIDENYISTSGLTIAQGRNFTPMEGSSGQPIAILGAKLADKLFDNRIDPIGKTIQVSGKKYQIIGTWEEKGSGFGNSSDNNIYITIQNLRQAFGDNNLKFNLNVIVDDHNLLEQAVEEASLVMRKIRKDPVGEGSSFEIVKSDAVSKQLIDLLDKASLFAKLIAGITLLGAAIALMNILLVSVTERTKEIGIRKAIGASSKMIQFQFLMEAIVICQMGGIAGIILGIGAGNIVSLFLDTGFIIPWNWMIIGFTICTAVALIAGIYPAIKASKLDPIDALRYE